MIVTADSFFTWITEMMKGVNFFTSGTNSIALLMLVLVVCILISPRKVGNIKILAFPVMVGFNIMNFAISNIFLGLAAIMFIMETLSLRSMQGIIKTVKQKVDPLTPLGIRTRKESERESSFKEAQKYLKLEKQGYKRPKMARNVKDDLNILRKRERLEVKIKNMMSELMKVAHTNKNSKNSTDQGYAHHILSLKRGGLRDEAIRVMNLRKGTFNIKE
jgi:hypothetical protein